MEDVRIVYRWGIKREFGLAKMFITPYLQFNKRFLCFFTRSEEVPLLNITSLGSSITFLSYEAGKCLTKHFPVLTSYDIRSSFSTLELPPGVRATFNALFITLGCLTDEQIVEEYVAEKVREVRATVDNWFSAGMKKCEVENHRKLELAKSQKSVLAKIKGIVDQILSNVGRVDSNN